MAKQEAHALVRGCVKPLLRERLLKCGGRRVDTDEKRGIRPGSANRELRRERYSMLGEGCPRRRGNRGTFLEELRPGLEDVAEDEADEAVVDAGIWLAGFVVVVPLAQVTAQ